MKLILTLLFSFAISSSAMALPKQFEVWFLSVDTVSWLDTILPKNKYSKRTAQRALQCQSMGEYCFDPQVGLYKKDDEKKVQEEVDLSEVENKAKYDFMDVPKSVDREMIDCEDSNFFDIFCGKAQKSAAGQAKMEVWIDVSSTMKQVDFKGFDKKCSREMFLDNLAQTCPRGKKLNVYYFEEFRKQAGAHDRVCLSGGLNDMKRLISDLKRSKADSVIIITDIFEAQETFIDAIEATGKGTIKGLDKPMYASNLKDELKRVRKFCQ